MTDIVPQCWRDKGMESAGEIKAKANERACVPDKADN